MTDADRAGDFKGRTSYSRKAVWVKSSTMEKVYPLYASSKNQNTVKTPSDNLMPTVVSVIGSRTPV